MNKVVTIFGSSDPRPGEAAYDLARQIGHAVASLGYAVANGGYRGTMEASAAGAKQAGGRTIAVVCSIWKSLSNPHIDQVIRTGTMPERLGRLVELGTGGYVALPGATGTLAELAWVWELVCKKQLSARPIICVGRFWQPLIDMMESARPGSGAPVHLIETPDQVAQHLAIAD